MCAKVSIGAVSYFICLGGGVGGWDRCMRHELSIITTNAVSYQHVTSDNHNKSPT